MIALSKNTFPFGNLLDEDYLNIKPGAIHGQENGIELLVDVESFEYGLFPKSARGFILALSDAGERPMIRQEGESLNFYFYVEF